MPIYGPIFINDQSDKTITGTVTFDRDNGGVLVVGAGTAFPSPTVAGELFWRTDESKLYRRNNSDTAWEAVQAQPLPHAADHGVAGGDPVTIAQSQVTNLTTDLASKVPTTRTVSAGTGLTGGGDLSANRSFAVSFGATAGTVTEGNDSRLSDSRTPTAHAASHKNGGSDEIATAISSANAIPKAGAGGKLAAGWIDDTSHGSLGGGSLHSTATVSVAGFMSAADKLKFDNISNNGTGDDWESGLAITEHNPKNQTVDYTAGSYMINGTIYNIASGGVYDLQNGFGGINNYASLAASQRAVVLIYVDTAQAIKSLTGTPTYSHHPNKPGIPSDTVGLAYILISKNGSGAPRDIHNHHDITDIRQASQPVGDELVRISATDTMSDFLGAKLTNNGNISFTLENAESIESLKADVKALGITDAHVATANKDGSAGTPSMRTLGTGASQAAAGNDSRLSDARAPTAHAASHKSGGSDAIKLDELAPPTDVVTLNATTGAHGLLPKLSGDISTYLRGDGAFAPLAGVGESNTASNVGTGGVGIFKQKSGVDLQFKKINAGSAKVTITDDTGNSEVDIDVVTGTSSNSVCVGNDSRLSDSRAPNGAAGGDLAGTYPNPTVKGASQAFELTGVVSPASIGANQNDYNPTGLSAASRLRLTSSGNYNITGLAGGASGRIVSLVNIGSFNLTLSNEDVNSTAANRFILNASRVVRPSECVVLIYDNTASRWRMLADTGDGTAFHSNISGEINGLTEKTTPVAADFIVIEDSASSYVKKKLQIGNIANVAGVASKVRQVIEVELTSDFSTSSTSFVTLISTNITISANSKILAYGNVAGNMNGTLSCRLSIDGTGHKGASNHGHGGGGGAVFVAPVGQSNALSAGSKTVILQIRSSASTINIRPVTFGDEESATLTIFEIGA